MDTYNDLRTEGEDGRSVYDMGVMSIAYADISQLGMLAFLVANIVGSSIQITTLPLPVLSTLQAVRPSSLAFVFHG
jgi:hypothetical protein